VDEFGYVTTIYTNPKVGLKVEDPLHLDREKRHRQFLAEQRLTASLQVL